MNFIISNIQVNGNDTVSFLNTSGLVRTMSRILPTSPNFISYRYDTITISESNGESFSFPVYQIELIGTVAYTVLNFTDAPSTVEAKTVSIYNQLTTFVFQACCDCEGGGSGGGGCFSVFSLADGPVAPTGSFTLKNVTNPGSTVFPPGQIAQISISNFTFGSVQDLTNLFPAIPEGSWIFVYNVDDPSNFIILSITAYSASQLPNGFYDCVVIDSSGGFSSYNNKYCIDFSISGEIGSIPKWQQTLDSDSTLNKDNFIYADINATHTFSMNEFLNINFNTNEEFAGGSNAGLGISNYVRSNGTSDFIRLESYQTNAGPGTGLYVQVGSDQGGTPGIIIQTLNAKNSVAQPGDVLVYQGDGTVEYQTITTVGTVTSVGLVMPNAFTVTNSPIIDSGDLTVEGAGDATEYINGLGELATLPVYTANNGLNNTASPTVIQLGGTLLDDTAISTDGNTLSIEGSIGQSTSRPFTVFNLGTAGVANFFAYGNSSSSSVLISNEIENTYSPLTVRNKYDSTGNKTILTLSQESLSDPVNSTLSVDMNLSGSSARPSAARLTAGVSSAAAAPNFRSNFSIETVWNSSGPSAALSILSDGKMKFNAYTPGQFSSAYQSLLAVNSSGEVVTTTGSGFIVSITGTAPINVTSGVNPVISMPAATVGQDGYLTSVAYNLFNNKQNPITLTTTGTSGPATFVGSTLNIPQYVGNLVQAGSGLSESSSIISLGHPSQALALSSPLTQDSYIANNGFDFVVLGTKAEEILKVQNTLLNSNLGTGFSAVSNGGNAIVASQNFTGTITGSYTGKTAGVNSFSNVGFGVYAESRIYTCGYFELYNLVPIDFPALHAKKNTREKSNDYDEVLRIERAGPGDGNRTPGIGFGAVSTYWLRYGSSVANVSKAGSIGFSWISPTTQDSEFIVAPTTAGVENTRLKLKNTGQLQLTAYTPSAFPGTVASYLGVDSQGNVIQGPGGGGGGGGLTGAYNGLSVVSNSAVLGGPLTGLTLISSSGYGLQISGNVPSSQTASLYVQNTNTGTNPIAIRGDATGSVSSVGVFGSSDTGRGVTAISSSGTGIIATSLSGIGAVVTSNSIFAIQAETNNSSANTVQPIMWLNRNSSSAAQDNIGGSINFAIKTTSGSLGVSNLIVSKWTNATEASRTSQFEIHGVNSAVNPSAYFTLKGTGQAQFNQYTNSSLFNGTVSAYLAVDAQGNVIQTTGGTGGGSLASLSDVQLGTLSNGQVLQYDSISSKWVNASVSPLTDGNKGDITVSGGGATWTINNNTVTYSKLQAASSSSRIIGSPSTGTAYQELTVGNGLSISTAQIGLGGTMNTGQTTITHAASNLAFSGTGAVATGTGTVSSLVQIRNTSTASFSYGLEVLGGTRGTAYFETGNAGGTSAIDTGFAVYASNNTTHTNYPIIFESEKKKTFRILAGTANGSVGDEVFLIENQVSGAPSGGSTLLSLFSRPSSGAASSATQGISSIVFTGRDSASSTVAYRYSQIEAGSQNHLNASKAGYFDFKVIRTGGLNPTSTLKVNGTGQIQFAAYTSLSAFPGTSVASLGVDNAGNIITITGGPGSSPLTTKGDLYTFDTTNARLPVGTNGQVLLADSTAVTGLRWSTIGALTDGNKGDITVSGGGTTWTINNDAVTYDKIQNSSVGVGYSGSVLGSFLSGASYGPLDVANGLSVTTSGKLILGGTLESNASIVVPVSTGFQVQGEGVLVSVIGLYSTKGMVNIVDEGVLDIAKSALDLYSESNIGLTVGNSAMLPTLRVNKSGAFALSSVIENNYAISVVPNQWGVLFANNQANDVISSVRIQKGAFTGSIRPDGTNIPVSQYESLSSVFTNNALDILEINRNLYGDVFGGVPSDGYGASILYRLSPTTGGVTSTGVPVFRLTSFWQNTSSNVAAFTVSAKTSTSASSWENIFTVVNSGQVRLNAYTSSSAFPGTSVASLAVDSNGNIITLSGGGGLSSVGLSMPSAFTVANSPLTANGTIAVTGAGNTGQYVRGDGTLANFPSTGGGGGQIFYFNGNTSQPSIGGNAYYELGTAAGTGPAANFTANTTGPIARFITDVNSPNHLVIPSGVWTIDVYLSEAGGGSNSAEVVAKLYKYDGSAFTLIATSPLEQITNGSTPDLYTFAISVPNTTTTATDRIAIEFDIQNTNGKTVTLYTESDKIGEVHSTYAIGISSLNGLTDNTQTFATGTAGTDFGISSTGSVHTFNLPTASASNRGALSSGDWTTFNNKQEAITGAATTITTSNLTASRVLVSNTSGKVAVSSSLVGHNLATLTDPSQTSYLKINSDNTVSAITAAQLKIDLGIVTNRVVLASNFTTTAANTYQTVTAFEFPVTSGKTYIFRVVAGITQTGQGNVSVTGPTASVIRYGFTLANTVDANVRNNQTAYDLPAANKTLINGMMTGEGLIAATATGTVSIRLRSAATGGVTLLAGSIIEWQEVL